MNVLYLLFLFCHILTLNLLSKASFIDYIMMFVSHELNLLFILDNPEGDYKGANMGSTVFFQEIAKWFEMIGIFKDFEHFFLTLSYI